MRTSGTFRTFRRCGGYIIGDFLFGMSNVVFKWICPVALLSSGAPAATISALAIAMFAGSLLGAVLGGTIPFFTTLRSRVALTYIGSVSSMALAAMVLYHGLSPASAHVIVLASGIQALMYALYAPVRRTLPFALYADDTRTDALQVFQLSYQIGFLSGPALGSVIWVSAGGVTTIVSTLLCGIIGGGLLVYFSGSLGVVSHDLFTGRTAPSLRSLQSLASQRALRTALSLDALTSILVTSPLTLVCFAQALGAPEWPGALQSAVGVGGAIALAAPLGRVASGAISRGVTLVAVQSCLFITFGGLSAFQLFSKNTTFGASLLLCLAVGAVSSAFMLWRTLFIQDDLDGGSRTSAASIEYMVTTSGPKLGDVRLSLFLTQAPTGAALISGAVIALALLPVVALLGQRPPGPVTQP